MTAGETDSYFILALAAASLAAFILSLDLPAFSFSACFCIILFSISKAPGRTLL